MNSGELQVDDVPLALVEESDVDDEEEDEEEKDESRRRARGNNSSNKSGSSPLVAATASPKVASRLGLTQEKQRSSSANRRASPRFNLEEGDSATGSLEDLVNSFDEKLAKVFHDYQEQVEKIAPVQVRSQEEIMNECQVWWTITGNFGNMMPIDWTRSTARAKYLPTLNLGPPRNRKEDGDEAETAADEDDDIVAADLDMHSMILRSNPLENSEPLMTAEDVIKEIDDMIEEDEKAVEEADQVLQGGGGGGHGRVSSGGGPCGFSSLHRSSHMVHQALAGRKLEELSTNELTQILNDIELLVRDLSEELVSDLGVRDELEFEKELKNTFISLLLSIQSKRRQHVAEGGHRTRKDPRDNYKYLTTVIPYQPDRGALPVHTLQVLVKILKAVNEDSPAVPALLTDYILKVLCPS